MTLNLIKFRARRLLQPAGSNRPRPLRWRYGLALRVPGHRLLVLTFGRGVRS